MAKNKETSSQLTIDDTYVISKRKGNGRLIRKVWINSKGIVSKYSLAYINLGIFQGDNGRVLGYDNNHGYDHKHYFGITTPVIFNSFEELEIQFESEFEEIQNGNF